MMPPPTDIGPPIQWSDEDLAQLSPPTPADARAAEALWQRDSPPWAKGLLGAQPAEDDDA